MKNDPRVRKDGMCYVCKEERPEVAVRDRDPFCSMECCREFHGIARKTKASDGRRMPTKATVAKQQAGRKKAAAKKKNPGANFEIRGKRSAKVKP